MSPEKSPERAPELVRLLADLPAADARLVDRLAESSGTNRVTTLVRAVRLLAHLERVDAEAAGSAAADLGDLAGAGSEVDETDPAFAELDLILTAAEREGVVPDGGWVGELARTKASEHARFLADLRRELDDLTRYDVIPVAALAVTAWWVEGYPALRGGPLDLRGEAVDAAAAAPPEIPEPVAVAPDPTPDPVPAPALETVPAAVPETVPEVPAKGPVEPVVEAAPAQPEPRGFAGFMARWRGRRSGSAGRHR